MEKTVFEGVKAPVDDEGFVQAFAPEDAEGQRAFFETYGFVVVRDVLDATEVEVCWPCSHHSSFRDRGQQLLLQHLPGNCR